MLDVLAPIAAACDLTIPAEHRLPIAVVGAGAIVEFAHLPAYLAAGLEVVGLYDLDADRAAALAERHGVGTVYRDLDELLDDDRAAVVDIAIVPWEQHKVATAALQAGKHLLCQKPLALEIATAERLVAEAEARGLQLAVQQQLRFDEGMAAARAMVQRGWIGTPTALTFSVTIATDFGAWPWLLTSQRLEIMYHSIHYLDAIRSVLGDPATVFCAAGRTPGQQAVAETRTMSTLVYDDGVRALVHVNHEHLGGDVEARFRIDGSQGAIRGTLGLLYDYPHGRPDTVEVFSRSLPTDGWLPYPVTSRWLPDAFAGPMGSLLAAIATGDVPATSGRDNLGTLRLVDALYRSAETGQAQRLI